MKPTAETTPLLGNHLDTDNISSHYGGNSSAISSHFGSYADGGPEVEEQSLNTLLSQFGSPGSTLGLSGGIGVYGASLRRRGSTAFFDSPRTEVPRARPSQPTLGHATLRKVSTTTQIAEDSVDEDSEDGKPPKFLYGVTDAQF